jgi:hypothetical protein
MCSIYLALSQEISRSQLVDSQSCELFHLLLDPFCSSLKPPKFAMAEGAFIWKPKRTMSECHALMHGPGAPLEMHHVVVDGRVHRMYKNAPLVRILQSLRPRCTHVSQRGGRCYKSHTSH